MRFSFHWKKRLAQASPIRHHRDCGKLYFYKSIISQKEILCQGRIYNNIIETVGRTPPRPLETG